MITTAVGTTLALLSINEGETHNDGWTFALEGSGEHDHLFTITNNELKAGSEYITPGTKSIKILATHNSYPDQIDTIELLISEYGRVQNNGVYLYTPENFFPPLGPLLTRTYEITLSYKFSREIVYPDPGSGGPYVDVDTAIVSINDTPLVTHYADGSVGVTPIIPPAPSITTAPGSHVGSDWFVLRIARENRGSGLRTYFTLNEVELVSYSDEVIPDINKLSLLSMLTASSMTVQVANSLVKLDSITYVLENLNTYRGIYLEPYVYEYQDTPTYDLGTPNSYEYESASYQTEVTQYTDDQTWDEPFQVWQYSDDASWDEFPAMYEYEEVPLDTASSSTYEYEEVPMDEATNLQTYEYEEVPVDIN